MALSPKRSANLIRPAIGLLSSAGVSDARILAARAAGMQNLQAHAYHLTNLAAAFLAVDRTARRIIGRGTTMTKPLSGKEQVWPLVQPRFTRFLVRSGGLQVSSTMRSGKPLKAGEIAATYLPLSWGGTQTTGGGGVSTLKRALKIGAHVLGHFGY
jgi:hypothetical protein